MRLSTHGRYGVRLMLSLAMNYGQGPLPLKEISKEQNISEHYLEQLIAPLRRAGMVVSIRGAHGGYELARSPEEITVLDIIRVLEGPVAPVPCVEEGAEEPCQKADTCVARLVWEKLKDSIIAVLGSMTLADMCKKAREMGEKEEPLMYYI